ncbi:MAG: protease inhibitor I42 family protein [Clostridia bacterium]|nr:protease inhibitor I42 family protein [Clostridia bacterium]
MIKRISLTLIFILLFSALFTGCGKQTAQKTYKIELEANETTGYRWVYYLSSEDIVTVKGEYIPDENKKGLVGVGGTQVFTVTGISEGEVIIACEYISPGEGVAEQIADYKLKVDKNLNITEVSKTGTYFEKDK